MGLFCSRHKIIFFYILISLLLTNKHFVESYSQVSRVGAIVNTNNSETINHNPGREGVFSSDNDKNNNTEFKHNDDDEITDTENNSSEEFTGRSASSALGEFQFPLKFNTKPISYRQSSVVSTNENSPPAASPVYVYPSVGSKSIDETYKYSSNLPAQPTAMDRFSPGEAYGFSQYQKNKNKKNNGYNYTPPKTRLPNNSASPPAARPPAPAARPPPPGPPINLPPAPSPPSAASSPTSASSPPGPVYIPPNDLYAFPPNIGSNYLPPNMQQNQRPVTSYLPPPAGTPDDFDPNSFVGPVNPKYLPSSNEPPGMMASDTADPGQGADSPPSDDTNHDHDHDHHYDHPTGDGIDYHDHHHHDHDHDHDADAASGSDTAEASPSEPSTENPLNQMMAMVVQALKNNNDNSPPQPPSPPSDFSPSSPPGSSDISFSSPGQDHFSYSDLHDHDHDHFSYHDHDHDHSFHDHDSHGQYGVDVYPEVIYDHDPHDHHHHHEITTTEPPPPPPEPRVTKYSYYYLGRKLWYVPLYFTVYFTFYVASLIIRSIGRHKVEFPNHLQKRSIHDMTHKETVQKVEKLTGFVMKSIEDFREKYL